MLYTAAMIAVESRLGRRIVGRLDRGVVFPEAILAVCRQHDVRSGECRAIGCLEFVELADFDQEQRRWKTTRKLANPGFVVLSLVGNVSERDGSLATHFHATLMRERDNGIEVVGGRLVSARVFWLEFVIEAFDDLLLRRTDDRDTGLPLWREAIRLEGSAAGGQPVLDTADTSGSGPSGSARPASS
ncbi:MAG: DUF296 domain-containing protein, partial [Pseudomonadota bacterium]